MNLSLCCVCRFAHRALITKTISTYEVSMYLPRLCAIYEKYDDLNSFTSTSSFHLDEMDDESFEMKTL